MEIEVLLDPVELRQATLGKAPEGLDSVDVHSVEREMLALVDPKVFVVPDIDQDIIAFPSVRVHDTLGIHTSPDDALKGFGRAVRDDLGVDPAVSLVDPEYRLLERSASSLPRSRPSPDPGGTEEAFVHLDGAYESRFLVRLVGVDQRPEDPKVAVDGLPVQLQKLGGFRRIDVDAETGDNFLTL